MSLIIEFLLNDKDLNLHEKKRLTEKSISHEYYLLKVSLFILLQPDSEPRFSIFEIGFYRNSRFKKFHHR